MDRWFTVSRYAGALAGVAAVTGFIGLVLEQTPIANVSMLYLAAVLGSATYLGRGPAVLAALASFISFNWFFVEPRQHITVADPTELFSLLLFLLTAVVTGQLAAAQRTRAQEAREREREARVLYDIVRLTADQPMEEGLRGVADWLQRELGLDGAAIQTAGADEKPDRITVGTAAAMEQLSDFKLVASQVLGAGSSPSDTGSAAPGRWVRVISPVARSRDRGGRLHGVALTAGGQQCGSLLLLRRRGSPSFSASENRLISAAAAQLALALERAGLRRQATESEVLRRADEAKKALLHAVSHDLRTPLSSIIAGATSLRQHDVVWSEEEREAFVASIEAEARRLDRLVANLLNISRIESGVLQATKEWHDLGALIDDVVARLRVRASRHRIVVDAVEDLPPVQLDYVEIEEVLTNLVENATKYAPAESEVIVRATNDGGAIRIEVLDRGPGIPAGASQRIFEAFERADPDRMRSGVGLGLAVAKRFVEAHGGRIWIEPRRGGGSTFIFTLPVSG